MLNLGELQSYYNPQGKYRKFLLKQEHIEAVDMTDYFSRLRVRVENLLSLPEMAQTTDARIIAIKTDAKRLATALRSRQDCALYTNYSKEDFCEDYDKLASVAEEMESRLCTLLDSFKGELSEDAHILRKRSHLSKSSTKDLGKSSAAKQAWKKNKHKYKQAVHKFHQSSAGKAFHRNLNRFNKMRVKDEAAAFSQDDTLQVCKGLSSLLTHLIIEVQNTSTQTVESVLGSFPSEINTLKELFHVFQGLLGEMFEAYYSKDREAMAEVLEVVAEYYELAEGVSDGRTE